MKNIKVTKANDDYCYTKINCSIKDIVEYYNKCNYLNSEENTQVKEIVFLKDENIQEDISIIFNYDKDMKCYIYKNRMGVNMNKFNFNNVKEYQNEIKRLVNIDKKITKEYDDTMKKYEYLLDNDEFEEWEKIFQEIDEKLNLSVVKSNLLKLEREYINFCKEKFIKDGIYNSDLKYLFDKAGKNIMIHEKLINKLMLL